MYRWESKDCRGIWKTGQKMLPAILVEALYLSESLHVFEIVEDDACNSSKELDEVATKLYLKKYSS